MNYSICLVIVIACLYCQAQAQTVTDYDGNVYNTVTIGTQVWTKENLRVKHFRNGDIISEVLDSITWVNQKNGAWCYNENNPNYGNIYGLLYNWYVANDLREIAPNGWHLPSDDEWKTLEIFLGMAQSVANLDQYRGSKEGNYLKETGTTTHWTLECCQGHEPNAGTNSSGFTALGGGFRWYFNAGPPYKTFSPPTGNAQFWTSSEQDSSSAWLRHLCVYHEDIFRAAWKKSNGSSIRLIKDATTNVQETNEQIQIIIYQSPANEKMRIEYDHKENLKVQIYNILGESILQTQITNSINYIDISSFEKGVYIIQCNYPNLNVTKKLIVW